MRLEDIALDLTDPTTKSEVEYCDEFLQKLETSSIIILDSKTTAETPANLVKLAQNYIEKFSKYSPDIANTKRAFIFHKDGHFDVVGYDPSLSAYDPSSPADDQKFKLFKIRGDGLCSVTAAIVAENFINTGQPILDDDQFIQHLNGQINGYEGKRNEPTTSPTLDHYQIKRPADNEGRFDVQQEVIDDINTKYPDTGNIPLTTLLEDYSTTDNYLSVEEIKGLLTSSRHSALEDADFVGNAVWHDIKTEISIPELKLTEKQFNRIYYLTHFTNGYRTYNLASAFDFEVFFPSLQEISRLETQSKNYLDTARLNSLTTFFDGFIEDANLAIQRLDQLTDENLNFSLTAAVNMHKAMVFLDQAGLQDEESVIKVSALTGGFKQILSRYYDKILKNTENIEAEHLIAIHAKLKDFKDQNAKDFCQLLQTIIASKPEAPLPPFREDPLRTEDEHPLIHSPRSPTPRHDQDEEGGGGGEEFKPPLSRPRAPSSPPLPAKFAVKKTQSFQDMYEGLSSTNYDQYLQTTFTKLTYFSPSSTSPIKTSYDLVPDYLKPIPTKQYKGWGLVFRISDDNKSIKIIKVAEGADGEIKKLQDKEILGINDESIEEIIRQCHQKNIDPTYKITSLFRLNDTLTLRGSDNQNIHITQNQKKIYQLKTTKTPPDISDPSSYSLEISTQNALDHAKQQDFKKLQTVHDIFTHINDRFDLLETMLKANKNLKIVMPAINPNHRATPSHKDFNLLGKGLAKKQWEIFFSNQNSDNPDQATEESKKIVDQMHELFRSRHAKLNQEFNTDEQNPRIIQDSIFPSHNKSSTPEPSADCLHIWGANADNWNLDENEAISGGEMANNLGAQRQGLFGIVTTPTMGIDNILEADKTYKPTKIELDSPTRLRALPQKEVPDAQPYDHLSTHRSRESDHTSKTAATQPPSPSPSPSRRRSIDGLSDGRESPLSRPSSSASCSS